LLAIGAIIALIFNYGYNKASEKYESIIKELEEENEQLSEPTAKYEIASKEINIDMLNSEIKDIGELATIEYLYTDAAKFEDAPTLFGQDIPFTTKSFIVKWDGIIKSGVKVDEIKVELNNNKKEIVVHIPKSEILSHEIDSDSIETLDEKNGFFNPIKIDDVRELDAIGKEAMEKRAVENGILEKAFENAKEIIYKLVNTDLVKEQEYNIIFKEME
jgi:hypothetical protein